MKEKAQRNEEKAMKPIAWLPLPPRPSVHSKPMTSRSLASGQRAFSASLGDANRRRSAMDMVQAVEKGAISTQKWLSQFWHQTVDLLFGDFGRVFAHANMLSTVVYSSQSHWQLHCKQIEHLTSAWGPKLIAHRAFDFSLFTKSEYISSNSAKINRVK